MDILDDMGASKLSAKVFLKVNYFFKYLSSCCIWRCSKSVTYLFHLRSL